MTASIVLPLFLFLVFCSARANCYFSFYKARQIYEWRGAAGRADNRAQSQTARIHPHSRALQRTARAEYAGPAPAASPGFRERAFHFVFAASDLPGPTA